VTGARKSLPPGIGKFLTDVRAVSPVPVAVGFGVSRPEHARKLAPLADGVIVASALVDSLGPDGTDVARMSALAASLATATRR
jgi:tryptophan synthase alpha chain